MVTRYRGHDTGDVPATQDSPPLNFAPEEHPMPEGDNELSDKCCEETDTHRPLAEILEKFCHLKDQFASLKSNTSQSAPTAELSQLTDKLQHITMMLQPGHSPVRNQCTKPCWPTQTPYVQHKEK